MSTSTDKSSELTRSWYDPAWLHAINAANVLDYFTQRTNPFYDRTCNNEFIKMQNQSLDQLQNMKGLEYILLLHQEPILYVIRKRERRDNNHTIPLVDYYVIAGIIYQSPDLQSVISSRLLNSIYYLDSAFETSLSYQNFNPSRGYWWDFKNAKYQEEKLKTKSKNKEEPSSIFQRQRVDLLLVELSKKFPPQQSAVMPAGEKTVEEVKIEPEIKNEEIDQKSKVSDVMKPPVRKK